MWERLYDAMMRKVLQKGHLRIVYPSGNTREYGDGTGPCPVVRIKSVKAMRRILLNMEVAVGESYMNGDLEVDGDNIQTFFDVALPNVAAKNQTRWQATLARWRLAAKRWRQRNLTGRARRNVAHHYDLSAELYDLFLDADRQYSCAYFLTPDDTLEQAQAQKKAHIGRKLLIEPGMSVLDIGCGWGGLGITLARDFGAHVIGVTLSEEQHKIACARVEAEGLTGQVEFRLQDYRHVPETFDRIVSVGMFEHVGVPHYEEYFGFVNNALREGGIALIHTIAKNGPPGYMDPWMEKYIFPGAHAPSLSEVARALETQPLKISDIEVLRTHYADTLDAWYRRFTAEAETAAALYDERFVRMWKYYLASSSASFRYGNLVNHQYQLAKSNVAVPRTRDYLYTHPQEDVTPVQQIDAAE